MNKILVIIVLLSIFIELNAQKSSALMTKGIKYLQKKDYSNAESNFTRFIAKEPACDSGYYYRGMCLFYLNNNNGAISDITRAIKINPNYTKAYYFRGQIHSRLGNSHEAIKDFTQVALLDPKTVNAYFSMGIEANKLKKYEEGRDYFTKVIELTKESKDAYKHRGFSNYMLKADKQAIEDCNKAEQMGVTDDPWLYKNRGLSKTELGDFDGAIADFNKAIAINKKYELAYKGRAKAYAGKQQWRNSIDDYTRFMESDPKNPDSFELRGYMTHMLGLEIKANPAKKEPEYESFMDYFKEAIDDYNHALRLNDKTASVFYKRGQAYMELGNKELALKDFTKAQELNPKIEIPKL